MKINHKILCIPPYISTSWKNVSSLRSEKKGSLYSLVVTLLEGSIIEIPQLEQLVVDAIFAAHAKYIESEAGSIKTVPPINIPSPPSAVLEQFGPLLQHNSQQYDAPNLPADVLDKITSFSQALSTEDLQALPKPEPHCNCPHCQITRAMHRPLERPEIEEISEELITDEDLHFHSWVIRQVDPKLYTVSSPDDTKEQYQVYLGSPIGCTCGCNHCEHIHAVLKS